MHRIISPIVLILVLAAAEPATAQQPHPDSLWPIWSDEARPDSIRLKAIGDLIWDGTINGKPDSAFYYAQIDV